MARSERYIAPSEEERRRIEQANQAAKEFDRRRGRVLRSALKRMKKAPTGGEDDHLSGVAVTRVGRRRRSIR